MSIAEKRPKIVVLDGHTLNPGDLSWTKLKAMGHVDVYAHSSEEEILPRAADAKILLVNKAVLDAGKLTRLPALRCICVTATGVNNIDLDAARRLGIAVCNVSGYGTAAVAQHVFALILAFTNRVAEHNQSVQEGGWASARDFCYTLYPIIELAGKTLGIYGFGRIGQQVGAIGKAFGMDILAHHKHPERDARPGVKFTDLDTLFRRSDFLSLHAPLTAGNAGIVSAGRLALMKPSAILINTSRGGLIEEAALKEALENDRLGGAALDVLSHEPPPIDHPLCKVKNCLITPHNAWASREARQRLLDATVDNVAAFLHGQPRNLV